MDEVKIFCYDCGKEMIKQEFYKDTFNDVVVTVPCKDKNIYYTCECGTDYVSMNLIRLAEEEYKKITGKDYGSKITILD